MRAGPKGCGNGKGIDSLVLPPDALVAALDGARHDPRARISTYIGGKKLTIDPPDCRHFENRGKGRHYSGMSLHLVISCVCEVVCALGGCDGVEDWRDRIVDGVGGALCSLAKPML